MGQSVVDVFYEDIQVWQQAAILGGISVGWPVSIVAAYTYLNSSINGVAVALVTGGFFALLLGIVAADHVNQSFSDDAAGLGLVLLGFVLCVGFIGASSLVGDWLGALLIATGGTILGVVVAVGAIVVFTAIAVGVLFIVADIRRLLGIESD